MNMDIITFLLIILASFIGAMLAGFVRRGGA